MRSRGVQAKGLVRVGSSAGCSAAWSRIGRAGRAGERVYDMSGWAEQVTGWVGALQRAAATGA